MSPESHDVRSHVLESAWSRRQFLRNTAVAGVGFGAVGLLAGCTSSKSAAPQVSASSTPRRGGQLRVGMIGGGKSESFSPTAAVSTLISLAMVSSVFDGLTLVGPDLEVLPALATKWTASADAMSWTFELRPGVLWHDGTPFTAEDVVYSIRWASDPANQLSAPVANVDLDQLKAANPQQLVVHLKAPDVQFPLTISGIWMIKNGTKNFTKPVGTGPFIFESLVPGQQAVCKRNPTYWDTGKPYVDSLVIKSITDDTARLNALLAGEIDAMAQVPFNLAKAYQGRGLTLLNSPSLAAQAFYMAVDTEPFTDVRVRQAMKLLVDRKQMVDVALGGFGTVANDLFGLGMPFYAKELPQRGRDVAKAKSLLADAGHAAGLNLTLETSTAVTGMVEAATLFAQQAAEGGVTIKVTQVDAASYFDPTIKYLKMPFAQTQWAGFANLGSFYPYAVLPGAAGNETHWSKPGTTAAVNQAISATTDATATAAWLAVQQEQYDQGGYIWWANVNNVDATSSKVAGIKPSKLFSLGLPSGLADAYFTS